MSQPEIFEDLSWQELLLLQVSADILELETLMMCSPYYK